jgi:hypothetical protein
MTTFTIDSDDHIAAATGDLKLEEINYFSSLDELRQLAAQWPASRLVRLWNSLPSMTPVRCFTDRKTAITRIWSALQNGAAKVTTRAKASRNRRSSSSKGDRRQSTRAERWLG